MTPQQFTRRSALALLGGAALAGCSGLTDGRCWDPPPSFDDTGLETVTRQSVPERPDPIPVRVEDEQRRAFRSRVADLLAPIPEPLTATMVPNGEIRQEIVHHRREAREALERMTTVRDTITVATAATDTAEHAARARGVWAAITTTGSPEAVTISVSELRVELDRMLSALPDVASGPEAGAIVYGVIEAWLDEARRDTLVGRPTSIDDQANPIRVGWLLGDVERIHMEIRVGEYIRDRYVSALDQPREVASELSAAVAELAPRMEDRIDQLHETEADRPRFRAPDLDELIERRYQRDEPGVQLFANKLYGFFEELRFEAIAWPGVDDGTSSLRYRNTYWAFSVLEAIDELRDRVSDGDDMFPANSETVGEARSDAIDAITALGRSESPLEQWIAWRLVPDFEESDERIVSSVEDISDLQSVARAYGEYVWMGMVGRAAADVTPTVTSVLANDPE